MMKFNFQFIKNLASPGVWRRGYSYYQTKQVENIQLCEEGIIGKVKGNFRDEYTTILKLSEDNVKVECDCPFPDEWCKHAVAVALISISDGLWDKYWGIDEEVEEEVVSYEGNYRFLFNEKSKPKTVSIKIIDRKNDTAVTQTETLLRSVLEAQKQNAIQLKDEEKKELYVISLLHKIGNLDKKREQFYVYYNNLNELMPGLGAVEDVRHAQTNQKIKFERNPLKLIMNINLSLVGNVLVALHWKRTNPEDIIPYEEVRLFAKRIQWGLYNNIIFSIETKVGELPYFLSKSSFLDIKGGEGGKFLFEQLPKFKESLEGELEIEESELVQKARLKIKKPKKVLTMEMPDTSTLRAAIEFDYDGVRVPYSETVGKSSYVCVVKGAAPQKQYSIEEFREQEAAKRKADIEAGIINPEKEEKKRVKVIRVKVIKKDKKAGKFKKEAVKTATEPETVKKEQMITQDSFTFTPLNKPVIILNDNDFAYYDDLFEPQKIEKSIDETVQKEQTEPEIYYEKEQEVVMGEEVFDEEIEEEHVQDITPIETKPPVDKSFIAKSKIDIKDQSTTTLASFDNLLDSITPSSTNILSQNMLKKKDSQPKKHKVVEDLDIFDKLFQTGISGDSKKTSKNKVSKETNFNKTENNKDIPPKKANKDADSIEDTIISVDNGEISEKNDSEQYSVIEEPKEIYWIKRDFEEEKLTYKHLVASSLTPMQTNKLEALDDAVVDFVGQFLPLLKSNDDWVLEYPEELVAIRIADEIMRFKVDISFGETQDNFLLDVACSVGKRELSLDEVQDLLKEGRKYVYASGAGYAEIPIAELLMFTKTLNSFDANKIDDSCFRVQTYKVGLIAELFDQNVDINMSEAFQVFWDLISSFSNFEETPIPENIKAELREYQKKGFAWLYFLYTYGLNGILADDMGLGKTLQALTLICKAKDDHGKKPSLVICPTSVVFNWEDEIKKFAPDLDAFSFTGSQRHYLLRKINSNDIVVTSYALIRRDIEHLKKYDFRYIILDESQKIKNFQSLTANVAKQLRSKHRLALSGTPIENRLSELWSVFDFLTPGFLYDYKEFKYRYAQPIEEHNNRDAERRLKKQVYPFILRRLKQNVAKDLPDKLEFLSYCELLPEQQEIYLDVLDYTRQEIFKRIEEQGFAKSQMSILSALLRLRQICCHPKLIGDVSQAKIRNSGKFEHLKDMIKDVIANGHRVLLFSQFVQMLELIKYWLEAEGIKHEYLTGATKNRKECVDRFNNNDDIPIFLISLKAGGTGLNLTGADYVIHYDPWWNPAVEDQATDRAHRIGQTKKVFVYRLITKGTVEEKMIQLQSKKRDLIDSVITVDTSLGKILTYEDLKDILTPNF